MMTPEKLLKELPPAPDDVADFIIENARRAYVIYNTKEGTGYCTRCGSTFGLYDLYEPPQHNYDGYCPCCYANAELKESYRGRKGLTEYGRILIFVGTGKNVYASLSMFELSFEGEKPSVKSYLTDVYKLNSKEQYRISYDEVHTSKGWTREWRERKKISIPGLAGGMWTPSKFDYNLIYVKNLKMLDKTDLRYADVTGMMERHQFNVYTLMTYISDSLKYQSLELLRKAGYEELVMCRIKNETKIAVNWRGKELKKILRMPNMGEVKKWMNTGITTSQLEYTRILNGYGINCKNIGDLKKYIGVFSCYNTKSTIEALQEYIEIGIAIKYLYKQEMTTRDLMDYYRECSQLKLDMKDKQILYPRNLAEAHARTSTQIKVRENARMNKGIEKQAAKMRKYNYAKDGLLIRVAETTEEIILEGKMMHHCVGGYCDKVARGETSIYLIRRDADPDKVFYTLELSPKLNVRQCRGYKNAAMTAEVEAFVNEWKKYITTVGKKKKGKEVA